MSPTPQHTVARLSDRRGNAVDTTPERVRVRVYGDLQFFTDEPELEVPIGAPRSVKDLLASVGVPHPEIAVVVVNGTAVGFDQRVRGGDRVAAYPPWHTLEVAPSVQRPRPAPRFVLDVHLGTLARRLGVLGLDVDYATDRDDDALARIADEQDRVLLTRDRQLLMRTTVRHGYCPRSDDPDEQVLEVVRRFVAEDDLAPFSRCPACNDELVAVAKEEVVDEIGPHTRATQDVFRRCPACDRVFWPGSHVDALEPLVDRAREAAVTNSE
jgi:hypothetical protein